MLKACSKTKKKKNSARKRTAAYLLEVYKNKVKKIFSSSNKKNLHLLLFLRFPAYTIQRCFLDWLRIQLCTVRETKATEVMLSKALNALLVLCNGRI